MTFNTDKNKAAVAERLAADHFRAAGYGVRVVPVADQLRGAGDLELTCPRTMLVGELEVKSDFGEGPNCLLELATHGSIVRASGVLGTRAEHVLQIRMRDRMGFLFRARRLEELIGDWLNAFVPIQVRDRGARSSRTCLPIPWREIERYGIQIKLGRVAQQLHELGEAGERGTSTAVGGKKGDAPTD